MKTIILLLALFPLTLLAQQDWPVIGAKWVQNEEYYYEPPYEYYILECIGETTINNIDCRIVLDSIDNQPFYIHQDGEQFYLLFEDSLHLIYDFDVAAGDTVTFELLSVDEIIPTDYVIDSVTQIVIDGVSLKKVYSYQVGFPGDDPYHAYDYIERIGFSRKIVQDRASLSTFPEGDFSWMRCYIDDEIEYHSEKFEASGLEDCFSDMLNNTENVFSDTEIKLVQNPVANEIILNIDLNSFEILKYEIIDLHGRSLGNGTLNTMNNAERIQITNLSKGIYFLNIAGNNQKTVLKFIKK